MKYIKKFNESLDIKENVKEKINSFLLYNNIDYISDEDIYELSEEIIELFNSNKN